ncbi:MAG: helicase-exonuclease AddAB subunit AddA [Lachnospiraceae bacterium]
MKISWTTDQQKVIDTEGCSILVPAAAGSGKTAVLIARILRKVMDGMDVDRLLVVTFTRAAAAEMKERLEQALEQAVEKEPSNAHLCRQLTLVHYASIMTIDSFCMSVVQNHFHAIDLEPGFRVGDEGELKLIQEDVLGEMMEDHYTIQEDGTRDELFRKFVDAYSPARDDSSIGEMILSLYRMAVSYPWPEEWLTSCGNSCNLASMEDLEQAEWMRFLKEQLKLQLEEFSQMFDKCLEICQEEDGPQKYLSVFEAEAEKVKSALAFTSFVDAKERLDAIKFGRKPSKTKKDNFSVIKADAASKIRNEIKDGIKMIQKQFFYKPVEEMFADIQDSAWAVSELANLTKEFCKRYRQAKNEKNLLDFNDLEHFALNILLKKTETSLEPTAIANQYRSHFDEIMIDEYQDSNLVQEVLLNSISRTSVGNPNVFMVGDVKQSIYKFRLARPELFMEKYNRYQVNGEKERKIELHQNFRSRSEVLNGINLIFYQAMTQKLGDITYTEETALYPSAIFEPTKERVGGNVEFMLLDLEETDENDSEEISAGQEGELNAREWEAMMIARKIQELTNPYTGQFVWDKEEKCYRRAKYQDVVVLLRTMSGWAENMTDVLMSQGIPAVAESRSGYFNATEVQLILNLLRIINNPRQDIPLAAVLHSPIGKFSSDELAEVHVFAVGGNIKGGLKCEIQYYMEHKDTKLSDKLGQFMEMLSRYRKASNILTLGELLWKVLEETGYYDYAYAMPAGEKRRANLDMLVEKAEEFEKTSYKGLFQFVRYIEKLNKYDVDFGEASAVSQMDCVHIMSIHKSKGLEFPIVILAGCAKKFNQIDARKNIAFQADFGVGMDCVRIDQRTKTATLAKKAVQRKILLDNTGEELRILYVAMTRAKEKLIVTAACKNPQERLQRYMDSVDEYAAQLSFVQLSASTCYLDFILPAVLHHESLSSWWQKFGRNVPYSNPYFHFDAGYQITCLDKGQLGLVEKVNADKNLLTRELFSLWDENVMEDEAMAEEIEARFSWQYGYMPYTKVNAALSVSELKRKKMEEEGWQPMIAEKEEIIPQFLQEKEDLVGAARGIVYHTVFEKLNFAQTQKENNLEAQLDAMVENKILSQQERECVRVRDFAWFLRQSIVKRAAAAQEQGQLFKEQQFLMGISAREVNEIPDDCETEMLEDMVLVKGIIDCYFIEKEEIVVLDYKTDVVKREDGEEVLRKRYQTQLDLYARALEQSQSKKVKEKLIYSVWLGKCILL